MSAVLIVALLADFGHGLVGLLGSQPDPDLQGVHADGELAADALKARLGVALQGNPPPRQTHCHNTCSVGLILYLSQTGRQRSTGSSAVFLHSLQQHVSQVTAAPPSIIPLQAHGTLNIGQANISTNSL